MRAGLLNIIATVGALAVIIAIVGVWLIVDQPVTVADAISTGQYQPLLTSLARELVVWCRALAELL
jgi:hypothetical protein